MAWPPTVGDTVRVKRFRNEWRSEPSQASGAVVSVEGSGDSAVYSVNCRTYRYIENGEVKSTALEPLQCSIGDLEPAD